MEWCMANYMYSGAHSGTLYSGYCMCEVQSSLAFMYMY